MRETEYAFGVARIRANESRLLTSSDIDQLVNAPNFKTALRLLADKGWDVPDGTTDFSAMLESESQKTWQLLIEAAPDIKEFNALIVMNDFYNLKAALKAKFSNDDADKYFVSPFITEPSLIKESVEKKNFGILPSYLKTAAEEGYDVIVRLLSGRLADVIIDRAALESRLEFAKESRNEMLCELAQLACACADIKIALRCARTGKDTEFIIRAMAECDYVEVKRLAAAALAGVDEICAYLSVTRLSKGAESLKIGDAEFEKWSDDIITDKVREARYKAFGIEPIVAYYIAKEAEIKNIRIILNAKINSLDSETIKKRVREVYV